MAAISNKATEFISALVKHLQAVCHGHVDFDENIKVVGHLFLTVDSATEFNYVLNEKVSKTDKSSTTFVSRSFYATDPQQKPLVKAELNENMTPPNQNVRNQWQGNMDFKSQFSDSKQKQIMPQSSSEIHQQSQQIRNLQKRSNQSVSPVPVNKMPRISEQEHMMQQNRQQQAQHVIYNRSSVPSKSDSRLNPQLANNPGFSGEFQKKPFADALKPVNKPQIKTEPVSQSKPLIKPTATPSPVAKPKLLPVPSTSQSPGNKNQVIDVDLTKVKEEPQDEQQYSAAEQKAFAEAWKQAQEEDYDGEYDEGDYGEEGYGEGDYNEEGYNDEEYGEGYDEENYDEFITGLKEKAVDFYPVGFVNQQGEHIPVNTQPPISASQPFVIPKLPPAHSIGAGNQFTSQQSITPEGKNVQKIICKYCGKFFAGETTLARHVKTQHLQIRVKCPICFVSFARKESLKNHMKKKHGEQTQFQEEIACPICEEPFTNKDQLQHHLFEVHRLNPPKS